MRPSIDPDGPAGRALVSASAIVLVSAGYATAVAVLAGLAGNADAGPFPVFVLTAIAALACRPASRAARRAARRLVSGGVDRSALLERFGTEVIGAVDRDAVRRITELVAAATGAERVTVWLLGDDDPVEAASFGGTSPLHPADAVHVVVHAGRTIGAISLTAGSGGLRPREDRLVAELASNAGPVLQHARLSRELAASIAETEARADELRASRRRIVTAHDEERRRLERDIHDGAQQRLVGLAVQIGIARTQLAGDPERAGEEVRAAARDAIDTVHALAGSVSTAVTGAGLADAVRAHAAGAPAPVDVHAEDLTHVASDVASAAYFVCLEAIQNASRHAGASRIVVRLRREDDDLVVSVSDDGRGFRPGGREGSGLANMAARASGRLDVRSVPGEGTTVTAWFAVHT